MKSKILKDYQLKWFNERYNLNCNYIELFINDKEKNAYCVLFGFIRLNIDYKYAIFYF